MDDDWVDEPAADFDAMVEADAASQAAQGKRKGGPDAAAQPVPSLKRPKGEEAQWDEILADEGSFEQPLG